ncbi:hypothetical protein ACQV2T_04210 [Facklamia sp. P13069]|uniref:hypothetical protein n=1 Tax=Facklamia sp. P13069 TaxID=3421954 RepID=UPI003D16BE05
MANDRHRAVARAKHKMEVYYKQERIREIIEEERYILSLPIPEQLKYRLNKAFWEFKNSVENAFSLLDKYNLIISKERLQKIFGGDE